MILTVSLPLLSLSAEVMGSAREDEGGTIDSLSPQILLPQPSPSDTGLLAMTMVGLQHRYWLSAGCHENR